MKAAPVFLLTVSLAMLKQGTGYAALSSPASEQTSARSSAKTAADVRGGASHIGPAEGKKLPLPESKSRQGVRTARAASDVRGQTRMGQQSTLRNAGTPGLSGGASKPLPSRRQLSLSGNAANIHEPRSDELGGLRARRASNNRANVVSAVHMPSVARFTPSVLNVRHRGPNPGLVGGSSIARVGSNAAIDGTQMKRRP
jgi:hypothetical protein